MKLVALVGLAVALAACGESKEEQANRTALAQLSQRHLAVMSEMGDWTRGAKNRSDTYGDVLAKLSGWHTEEDSVQHDLRRVIATPKFSCLAAALGRSVDAHTALLEAEATWTTHLMRASGANDRADEYRREEARSEYASDTYSGMASEANTEALNEIDQASKASDGAQRAARVDWAEADTLRTLIRSASLLAEPPAPAIPVIDQKNDSLLVANADTLTVRCPKSS